MRSSFIVVTCVVLFALSPIYADERLKDIACRSVHLAYDAAPGVAFYNEVTVDRSAPGTYFCACGWNQGYFGIQELASGNKVVIFSVWDSNQNDPKAVPEEKRVKLLHKHEQVRTGRFGGEGSGGQSFLDYDWKVGVAYRFLVTAKVDGDRTQYAGYLRGPDDNDWKHLVTFSTVTGGKNLGGYYAFVEDFKRDRRSATIKREAHFGSTWVKTSESEWAPVVKARFTADSNPATNIDAGVDGDRFFLATGGDTNNQTTKLKEQMRLSADASGELPEGLPESDRP